MEIMGLELEHADYLSDLDYLLTLWCIAFELEKCSDYFTGLRFILYIGLGH